jgi:hypothetical protein
MLKAVVFTEVSEMLGPDDEHLRWGECWISTIAGPAPKRIAGPLAPPSPPQGAPEESLSELSCGFEAR